MNWENTIKKNNALKTVGDLINQLSKMDKDALIAIDMGELKYAYQLNGLSEGKIISDFDHPYEFVRFTNGQPNQYDNREVPPDARDIVVMQAY